MATNSIRRIFNQSKRDLAEIVLGRALGLLGNNPDRNAQYLLKAIDHITRGEQQEMIRNWFHGWLEKGKPGREFLSRIACHTNTNVRRRFLARMIVSMFFKDKGLREACIAEYGIESPCVMLISPTMRCNYRCLGCYAGSYEKKDDMKPEVLDRVLCQAEDMGINFFVMLGGEPFIYPELLSIIRKHNKVFFQIYTNGSFIDEIMAEKLVRLGNVAPQISVNGPREYTDASRGKGAFDIVIKAMDNLREAGAIFGFSSLVTRHNVDIICSEQWIDMLIEKGALYGWLFLYMPVGDNPDMNLMPTPEQRNKIRLVMRHIRQTKPIFPLDFWSDGTLTGGCIAGGRQYLHINHRGDVEPCIFCHFATHNIYQSSLAEAVRSPFFRAIRERQPFSYNTLRPCPMIDHPHIMWNIIQQHGAKPTHHGAEKMFTTFASEMNEYAYRVEEIMDNVWETDDYHQWAPRWTSLCNVPSDKLEARREEFEMSRRRKKETGNYCASQSRVSVYPPV